MIIHSAIREPARTVLSLIVGGTPRPQGSLRAIPSKHTGGVFLKGSDATTRHRNDVAMAMARDWAGKPALDAPVVLLVSFHFPRPTSHLVNGGKGTPRLKPGAPVDHQQDPDTDKLVRLICDAAVAAQVLVDDNRVVSVIARKLWADPGTPGKTIVYLYSEERNEHE